MCNDVSDPRSSESTDAAPLQGIFGFPGQREAGSGDFRFADFIASAESVLRGEKVIRGPLAWVADARMRIRLAAALMQHDVECYTGYEWLERWRRHVDWTRFYALDRQALTGDSCPCGAPVSSREGGAEAEEDEGEPVDEACFSLGVVRDSGEAIARKESVVDSSSHGGAPAFWHVYRHSRLVTPEQRRRRNQAVEAFPAAIYLAAHYAQRAGCDSRRASAWAVLDAVDRGERLIPALVKFLGIPAAAVRAGRIVPMPPLAHLPRPGRYRRVFRVLQVARGMSSEKVDLARLCARDFDRACILDMLSRTSGYGLHLLLDACMKPAIVSVPWTRRSVTHERQLLRRAIRRLRAARRAGMPLTVRLLRKLLVLADELDYPRARICPLPVDMTLPCGWRVRSITSTKSLLREGREMRHCIARFADEFYAEEIQVFSFRSPDGAERATLKVELPCVIDPDWELHPVLEQGLGWYGVELAGRKNLPVSAQAVLALGEFLVHLDQPKLRVLLPGLGQEIRRAEGPMLEAMLGLHDSDPEDE